MNWIAKSRRDYYCDFCEGKIAKGEKRVVVGQKALCYTMIEKNICLQCAEKENIRIEEGGKEKMERQGFSGLERLKELEKMREEVKEELVRVVENAERDKSIKVSYWVSDGKEVVTRGKVPKYKKGEVTSMLIAFWKVDLSNLPDSIKPKYRMGDRKRVDGNFQRLEYEIKEISRMREFSGMREMRELGLGRKRKEGRLLWCIENMRKLINEILGVTIEEVEERYSKIMGKRQRQLEILDEIRRYNSEYFRDCRNRRREIRKLVNRGEIWKGDKEELRKFFEPPFRKSYLSDVSERWRAVVFLEVEYNYRYGLTTTGSGYICGIDDNGQKWGRRFNFPIEWGYDVTVEDAMVKIFEIRKEKLSKCVRQGDVLFYRLEEMKVEVEGMKWEEVEDVWVNGSHRVFSLSSLYRGEDKSLWIKSDGEIRVEHRDHPALTLSAGVYQVYTPRQWRYRD